MEAIDFFTIPQSTAQKQYEALRAFYLEGRSAAEVAEQFGYTISSFYALNRDFKQRLKNSESSEQFFVSPTASRSLENYPSAGARWSQSNPQGT